MTTQLQTFWNNFLTTTNRNLNTALPEAWYFCNTEQTANDLLDLVLIGKNTATSSSYISYSINNEQVPKEGDLSIITSFDGTPRCIIKTTSVLLIPFKDITYDICKREGEDDSLESWQNSHIAFFTSEGNKEGYTFSKDMLVVFEDFEVIYK